MLLRRLASPSRTILFHSSLRAFASIPEPVRLRLPEDDVTGVVSRSIPKWYKQEGDQIKPGEPLCEVDAGDVVYDFNSPVQGWLVKITAKPGSSDLKGGEVIAYY